MLDQPAMPAEPVFTLKASDPCAPFALLAYASVAHNKGYTAAYVQEMKTLAQAMYSWQDTHGIIMPGRAGPINEKISKMFNDAAPTTRRLPDDDPLAQRLNARYEKIKHPSGDDGGDGMAWVDDTDA